MKLEIGSGRKPTRGYKNIDIENYANPNYLGDFRTMNFEDLEEIKAYHLLEHFSREEGIEVLKQWHSWLKKGGLLNIQTPDFEEICSDFSRVNKYWMTRHAFGSQEADWAFHKDGWYQKKFEKILPKLGFKIIEFNKTKSRKILPNITVLAKKL